LVLVAVAEDEVEVLDVVCEVAEVVEVEVVEVEVVEVEAGRVEEKEAEVDELFPDWVEFAP